MSLTVAELTDEVRDTNRRLTSAIDALRTEVADLRVEAARINANLGWLKGVGRIVAGSTVGILILIGTGVYRFGHVENAIAELQRDTAELRKDTAELRSDFKARDDRLTRALERVEKALPPAPKGSL
jgi:prefoldin subunit 5